MKKLMLMVLAMFAVSTMNGQIADQIKQSRDRAAKLQALTKDYKSCGDAQIDGFGNDLKNAAVMAINNSELLENLYKREIGQIAEGVQDVTVKKPTLEDWKNLATSVAAEGVSIKAAVDKAKSAAEGAKKLGQDAASEKNPMKVAKVAKKAKAATAIIEFGNAATPILLEESAAQVKAVAEIIKTIQAGNNL